MKKILMALLWVLLFAGSVSAEPIILKFAHFEPSNKTFTMEKIWLPWVDEMNKAGEGMFKIEVYVGGALNPVPPKQLHILREGVADIAYIVPIYTPEIFADDSVAEVPFIASNAIDASLAINNMLHKNMLKNFDTIVPLMLASCQQAAIHSTFPIKTPGDLKGKKIATRGQLRHLMAKSFGATPIVMSSPKIAASMNQGANQATFMEWFALSTFELDKVAKHHCMLPMGTVNLLLAMNKDSFNKLPKKAQDLFLAKREYTARLWADQQDMYFDEYYKKIKADPEHHVYIPTAAETEEWKQAIDRAVEQWIKEDPYRKELLETYKKEVAKARQ